MLLSEALEQYLQARETLKFSTDAATKREASRKLDEARRAMDDIAYTAEKGAAS